MATRNARGENEKGEGRRSRATPSFPLLNPHPLGYAKDASVCLQSDNTTECIFNGAAELLKRLGGAYCKLQLANIRGLC